MASGFVYLDPRALMRGGPADCPALERTVWHELLHYGLRRFSTREQYINSCL